MHCPGCCGKVPSNTLAHVGSLCPGVTCSQCAQNAVLIAELWEQLNTKDAEIARLRSIVALGRYKSDHCPGCEDSGFEDCPGVTCPACEAKDAEIARLQRIIDGHDLIMMRYQKAMDEIACLRALVAVGRDMADQCYIRVEESKNTEECSVCILCGDGTEDHSEKHTELCPVGKWRSLEGK